MLEKARRQIVRLFTCKHWYVTVLSIVAKSLKTLSVRATMRVLKETRQKGTGGKVIVKSVSSFAAVAALALVSFCRMASADETFSFTGAQIEAAVNADSAGNGGAGFGAGACGNTPGDYTTYCGIYDIALTANVPATVGSMQAPASPGAPWETYLYPAGGGAPATASADSADFYADIEDTSDASVAFLTTNINTLGQQYCSVLNTAQPCVTGTTPLNPNEAFTFTLSTNGPVTFALAIQALPLNLDGTGNASATADGKYFTDTSITNFAVATPEPVSGGLLCSFCLAAWGIHRKRRLAQAEASTRQESRTGFGTR